MARPVGLRRAQRFDRALAGQAANGQILISKRTGSLPGDFLFRQLPDDLGWNADGK
jgi:hypothetical protein